MVKSKMEELALLAKTKEGYTKDTVMNIICICCSKEMNNSGYTPEQALGKAISFVEKDFSKEKLYTELLKMTGVE